MAYNSQCGRVDSFEIRTVGEATHVYLDAHGLAVEHIRLLLRGYPARLTSGDWPEMIVVPRPLDSWAPDLLSVMSEVVITRPPEGANVVLALDWYQQKESEDADWTYTPCGRLVHESKYEERFRTPPEIEGRQQELATRMASVIGRHVLYAKAEAIVTVPSSILRNHGYAERLAEFVAAETELPLVRTNGKTPVRPQRKSGAEFDLTDEFIVPADLVDDRVVLIVDDLYREGATIRGVALAARRAGARVVLGLAAARTMRN